ncbi:autotransporter outer membrane beta-barrel domain-containing protein [Microbulbifer spongiae]|uniref:Autotransporter domain-containing protein n=1 Tax=Microbulbifer spongiae TaxID=2944933 RepID=A0ABY9E9D8_9GAMM|nr:autotransporter domain-containing protein [Microbulbifer sp. MI-G]WKD49613.1 autotransporter domain-containing protein [Microbulbifer sp. MI-G]
MSNAKRSLAAAIALVCASTAYAQESPFSQVVAFGDSLTDVGNAGIFTSGDNKQAAISIMSQQLGLGPLTPSCADLNLCLPEVDPSLSEAELLASAQAQVQAALPNVGGGWAVGGHHTADVLLNILGTRGYLNYLSQNGMTLDVDAHNFVSALLPDPTRETSTGLYPDLEQLGLFLQGDDAALAAIVADSGITGNPHPLGLGYLETTFGRADPKALYWVNGGGNDLIGGFGALLSNTIDDGQYTADINTAANILADAAGALSDAGANYILVSNVPDVSKTPGLFAAVSAAVAGSAEAAQLQNAVAAGLITAEEAQAQLDGAIQNTLAGAGAASNAFNQTLVSAARDIDGVLIVDQFGVLQVSLANAAAFGLSPDLDQSRFCYDGSGGDCIEHPVYGISGSDPNDARLLFNDGIHPTQVGQNLLADYYTAVVNAAQVAGQLPDLNVQAARTHTNTLDARLLGSRYRDAHSEVFVSGVFGENDYDGSLGLAASGDGSGGLIGATYALRDNAEVGFALSRSDMEADNSLSAVESTATNYSLFGRFHHDIFFIDASATLTDMDYDRISRNLRLGSSFNQSLDASTGGESLSLSLTGGVNLSTGAAQFGPFANATQTRVKVDAYSEDAISGFTYTDASGVERDPFGMSFGAQERRYTTMRVGAFASMDWNSVSAYGQIWYEDTTGNETDSLEVGVKSIEGNMNAMPSYDSTDTGLFEDGAGAQVGLRWQLASAIDVSANLTARPTSETGAISVSYRF